jgi:hypothetical protein
MRFPKLSKKAAAARASEPPASIARVSERW